MATTIPISQGFAFGLQGSEGRGDFRLPTEELSDRELLKPAAFSAMLPVYSCS
jgi:hypothetical protein